ncbi:Glycosyl transferase family 2 [Flavobacterium fluvii]|uniref:Glycosyl transferase family 2 n=1 Tax=Flavobacterium fluvii TaxID=468056 RepID=A0A1M5IQJ8_9FLAO|nr:glycosyltransferase family 2 protein [Flavobacterium fluvii]SHG30604.1 Glycosyl transferase family 2 [Flavobacterium fluvii]
MISVLIRNKNEALSLEKAIKSILVQHFTVPFEIVVVDDASSDNSIEIANQYGCKVVSLDKAFTYGYAINFGVKHCKYDIVLLLSSHNILLSNDFPEKLIKYFIDPKVAGVRCTPIANSRQVEQSLDGFLTIDKDNYSHSNDWQNLLIANCSAIRKNVALEIGFNETIRSNEEKLWCLDIMEKGYSIISNTPCYFLYNKKNNSKAIIRDSISKYQIDGIKPKSLPAFLFILLKSIPWAIKIAVLAWFNTIIGQLNTTLIPYKYRKGIYK